jgi:predicted DCC family thiol-disulfide oxidoreductase YuxK
LQSAHNHAAYTETRSRHGPIGISSFREIFGVDLRTLALFRILLGAYLVLDLCLRARDLAAHYTDFGIMPRGELVEYLSPTSISIHMMNGTAVFQAALFALAGAFALMMIAGWRTRFATAASWFLLLSLQNRNTVILSGEDNLIMVLMFWAMFLPLGARYSVDAALDKSSAKTPNAYFSIATLALLVQGMSMYFFSALLKSDAQWIPSGAAVYYALQLDYFVTPFALWFRQFETLLEGLTYYVWALELIGPILIFSPILQRPLRVAVMLAFMTMHVGFFMCLEIGLFPLISIIMNLTFMPGWMWDRLGDRLRTPERQNLHIWYDHDCDFCLKICRLLKTFLVLPDIRVQPAQDDPDAGALLSMHNSWVVGDGEAHYLKWDAMCHLVARSPLFWPMAKLLSWAPLRRSGDFLYLWVSENRSALAEKTNAILPWRPLRIAPTRTGSMLAGLFLVFVTLQNMSTLPAPHIRLPDQFFAVRQFLGLYQNWTMFAPHPELTSPWPIIPGQLKDGSTVDVYNHRNGAPDLARPDIVSAVYANYRWRKYLSNLEDQSYEPEPQRLALNYARYLCRVWNTDTPPAKQLSDFEIIFNVEWTPPRGMAKDLVTRTIWSHDCFG